MNLTRRNRRILTTSIAAYAASLLAPHTATAATSTWAVNAAGNWSLATNWAGSVIADGAGFNANFTFDINADRIVTLDTVRTIWNLLFTDASNNYTIAGTNVLTLDVASGNSSLSMTNAGRTGFVNTPLAGNDGIILPTTSLGIVSLGSNNSTYTGQVTVSRGATLQLGAGALTAGVGGSAVASNTSLGAGGVGNETIVQAGGALNINAQNTGNLEIVRIAGYGNATIAGAALVNNGGANNNALSNVALTGDAAIGGTGRFDIRNNVPLLDLAGFRLSKIGANQFSVVGGMITPGNIDVSAGLFAIESNASVQGAGTISIGSGGTLALWNNVAGAQTRTIQLAGGNINEQGSASLTSTVNSNIVLSNNTAINVGGTATTMFTLPGNITQTAGNGAGFGITKTGGGTLQLNGTQTWTGALTINDSSGRVNLGANAALSSRNVSVGTGVIFDASALGGYAIPNGGTFTVGTAGVTTGDVIGNFTAGAGTTLNVGPLHGAANTTMRTASFANDLTLSGATLNASATSSGAAPGAGNGRLNVLGNLNLGGITNVNLFPQTGQDYRASSGFLAGASVFANYTGALTGSAANLAVANAADYRQTFSFDTTSTPNVILLNVAGTANTLTWDNGAANGVWDVNSSVNWSGDKFYQLDRAVFGATGAGSVRIAGTVRPSGVDFTAGNYTIGGSGIISGPAIVTKSAGGRTAITGEFHDFSGGTTITDGTLAAFVIANNGTVSSLGTGSVILDGASGALEYTGGTATANRTVQLGAAGGTIQITNPLAALTLSTALTDSAGSGLGARTLNKIGMGALTLSAAPTFTGNIAVFEGVLRAGIANLGKTIDVAGGATFDPNGFNGNTAGVTRPTLNIAGFGVPGQAAIWNGGGAQTNTPLFGRINLVSDAAIGSPVRYDLNGGTGTDSVATAGVTFNANTYATLKVGTGEMWWSPNLGAVLNDVLVQQGIFGVQQSNNMASSLSITGSAFYVGPVGQLATFGDATTNIKHVVLNGGLLSSTGGGGANGQFWRGGVELATDSFLDNRGVLNTNNITIDSDATQPTIAPLTLGGATLEKLASNGLAANAVHGALVLQDTGVTGLGSGDGTLRIYNGGVTMRAGFKMDGAGEVRLQNFGQLNLDDTGGAVTLTKIVKLDGGTLNNAVGSHTTGGIVVGAHGRVFNSAAGTTLTLGNITAGADNGIQFGTTGTVALSTINGAAPLIGAGNRLGVNWTAGATPATTGFATWDGVAVGTLAATATNSTTPTAADDSLYTAATTLSGSVSTNTLVSQADVIIPSGALLTIESGGIVMRGADHSINTAANGTGRLTTGATNGRLVINAPELIDSRGALHIRAQMVDTPLAGGAFRPMTAQKNGPGVATQWGTDNGGNMLNNLYSGGTIINGGRVVPNGTNALGTGPVTINDGGQLGMFNLTGAAAGQASYIHNNIAVTGRGAAENAGYLGAIRMAGNGALTGNMSVTDVTRIHNQNGGGNLAGIISGTGTVQHTGNNITWVTNPGSTYTGVTELGFRDQTGAIQILVSKLADGGLPSSIGASSSAASNLVLNISPILRYVGNGDSTDRLFTLGGGYNTGGTPNTIIDGSGYGAVNFTSTGALEFGPGSYRQLVLRASSLSTGATVVGGQMPLNIFAPNLGDPIDHGFGQLVKDGIGRWAITADHTYSGTTAVNDGILILGNGGTSGMFGNGTLGLGPNQVSINNNASVHLNRSDSFTIPNTIVANANGNAEVVQIGAGTATLAGYNDNSSTRLRVESGVLELAKASNVGVHALALLGTVNGGTLRLGGTGDDQIFDGVTSGVWTTIQMNGGSFDMNGRNEAVYRVEGSGGVITNSAAGTTSTLTLGGNLLGVGNGSSVNGGGVGSMITDGAGTVALTKVGTGRINLTGANSYSGVTTVNNGILAIGNGGTSGSLGTAGVVTGVNGTLAIDRSDVFTLANPVTGNGGITQQGRGTTVVNGGLAYTGVTTVNAGTLRVDLSAGSNILPATGRLTLNGGNVLFAGGNAQTVGSLHIAGGDVNVDGTVGATTLNLPAAFTRLPGGTANFSVSGAGVINSAVANVNNIVGSANAAYATFGGTDWATGTGINIAALAPGGYTPDVYAPGTHTDVTAAAAILGGNTGTIRFNTPATNVLTNGGALILDQGGILVTPAMAAGSAIVGGTITGGATAGNEVVIHQHTLGGIASATQIASAIVDNAPALVTGLTKAGPGIVALTGANTYTGDTHVNQGILSVGAFGTAGNLGQGPVYNDGTLAFARTDSIRVENVIGGSGQVVQAGGGTVRLMGANTFTGGMVVAAGTVLGDRGFGGGANTGNNLFSLGGGTTLALANSDPANAAGLGSITLGDASTGAANVAFLSDGGADFANSIIVSSLGTGTATIGSNSGPVGGANPTMFTGPVSLARATTFHANNPDRTTYLGVISGSGIITISGAQAGTNGGGLNRTTWENTNTFTGNIVIAANSTLQVGTGAFAAPLDQVPDTADVTLNALSFFTLNGDSETIGTLNSTATNSQVQSAAGGSQSLRVMNGGTFNGILHGSNGGGQTLEVAGGTMTIGGTVDNNSGRILVTGGTAVFNKASTTGVHASALDLTVAGGTVQISGTFGGTAPNYGTGVVLPGNFRDQIFDGSAGASSSVVMNGGTLDLNGLSEGFGRLDGYGGLVTNSVAATTSTLFVGTTNHSNLFTAGFNGNIADGAGIVALGKVGTGIAVFNSDLNYTGGTSIYAGALQIGNGGATGTISGNVSLVNANTASLIINRSGTAVIPANISGGGPVILNGSGTVVFTGGNTYTGTTTVNDGVLQVGNGGTGGSLGTGNVTLHGDLSFNRSDLLAISASIAGGGSMSQDGGGITDFTGIATHTGGTEVNAGTLRVTGSISGVTDVNNGGTLGGTGLLDIVNVLSGGIVSPGAAVGVLSTGAFTMSSGSTLAVEINTTTPATGYDQLNVAGAVNLGNATLTLGGTFFTPTVTNDLFFIVLNDGVDPILGTFAGLVDGSHVFAQNGQDFIIGYSGDSTGNTATGGNDVVLTAVPEPASATMLLGGLATILGLRRNRRRP